MLRVALEASFRNHAELLKQWPQRTRKLRARFLHTLAKQAFDEIYRRIPTDPELADYREALALAQVTGVGRDENAYAVFVDARRSRVRKLDGPKTLLYVRPKKSLRRTPEDIKILEKYSPWTLDTLPYAPKTKLAVIVSRIASKSAVAKAAEQRQKDKPKWKRELVQAGVRGLDRKQRATIPRRIKALPEVAVQAISLEFGLSGKSKVHWRPAVSKVRRRGLRLLSDPILQKAILDLGFTNWRRWPGPVGGRVGLREVRKFAAFQKRLGIA